MRRIPSWLGVLIGVVLAAVVVGAGVGWWVSRESSAPETKSAVITTENNEPASNSLAQGPHTTPIASAKTEAAKPEAVEVADTTAVAAQASAGENQWQDALDEVITSDGEPDQKADRLLRMLPHLKEEAQVEVSQHLVNFVGDDHYVQVAQMLTNASTLESVSTVLMTDLLNRNDGLKLPLLLTIAQNEGHPKHAEAKDLLELYLQENHGDNWNEWQSSVTNYLTQNGADVLVAPPEPTADTNTP